jgi:hypothetical protein
MPIWTVARDDIHGQFKAAYRESYPTGFSSVTRIMTIMNILSAPLKHTDHFHMTSKAELINWGDLFQPVAAINQN